MNIFILNLRGNIIGDSIKESSLFAYLKNEYPDSRIITTGNTLTKELHKNNPNIDELFVLEELDILTQKVSKVKKMTALLKALFKSRKLMKDFDVCVITQKYTCPYALAPKSLGIEIWQKEKLPYKEYPSKMYFKKEESAKKFVSSSKRKKIAVNTESKDSSRCWDLENYENLFEQLVKDYEIYLLGVDKDYNSPLTEKFDEIVDLVGKTSIRETALVIKEMDLYIGNDSGLTHIAAAVDTNSITIFIDTDTTILNYPEKSTAMKLRNPTVEKVLEAIKDAL